MVWNNICYSDDISEFVFDRDEENSDQLDFEASSDFEDEIDDDIDSNTDHLFLAELCILNGS